MKPIELMASWRQKQFAEERSETEKINILMVDDQPANLFALESLLDNDEYSLVKASSGNEALRLMLQQEFALVLLDVLMPIMDGFETAEMIRLRTQSTQTPIIFLTASNSNETHVSRGYSLGAVDYIYKPIVPEILKAKVQVFVDLYRKTERLARSEAALRRELAERIKAEEGRQESEERYRGLFARASDAIIIFDSNDRVLEANQAALKLYGYARKDLLKLSARDLDPASEGDRPSGQLYNPENPLKRTFIRDQKKSCGETFPAEITSASCMIRGKKTIMILARDITERRKAEETERLRERGEMQRQLVATVSHELRTPIAAIKASAETLRHGVSDKDRSQFIKIIDNQSGRLGSLVEDLLAVAELESGKSRLEPVSVPLPAFTQDFIRVIKPLAERKKVSLHIDVEENLEVWVDQAHLARTFQNLVDNAIKYNKKGGSVRVEARAISARETQISVRDTGIGIPEKDLARIFHQFHRTEKARELAVRGSGLGLYIIKTIVESNGGRIWAESVNDRGSVFHVVLPSLPPPKERARKPEGLPAGQLA